MILEDTKGNLFNVEMILEVEKDPSELKLLAEALYEKLKDAEEKLALIKAVNQAKQYVKEGRILPSEGFKKA